jgi:hypothetical protein
MITREWLAYEIKTLREELEKAKRRMGEADLKMIHATDEYRAACTAVEALEGCLRGLRDELNYKDQV